jgi:hypothetical protein
MKSFSSVLAVLLTALRITSPLPAQPMPADAPLSANPALLLQLVDQGPNELPVNSRTSRLLAVQVTEGSGVPVPDAAVAFRLPDNGATGSFPDGSHAIVRYTDANGRADAPAIQWNGVAGPVSIRITAAKGTGHAGLLVDEVLTDGPSAAAAPPDSKAPNTAAVTPGSNVATADLEMGAQEMTRPGVSSADLPLTGQDPPSISITSASPAGESHSRTKWVIVAALVAAAGAGAIMALHGGGSNGGSSAAVAAPGISIGSPSISVGHP